jgi:hypothetical protein
MKEDLGRCATCLRKTVEFMCLSTKTPRQKLMGMTHFGGITEADFPAGSLRDGFQAITAKLSTPTEPQWMVNISAMSDEEAEQVIKQIYDLADSVAYELGVRSRAATP